MKSNPIDDEENKKELFGEMANKWQDDTDLPMIIWIDEGRLYQRGRHAKRIKFQLNTSDNVDRRKMGEMDLFGNVLEPTGKKVGRLHQYEIRQLQNFVNNNHYALEKISDTEIRVKDIWDCIIMGGEKADQSQIDVLNATVDDIIATKKDAKKKSKLKNEGNLDMKWKPIDNNSQTVWQKIVNESVASAIKRIGGGIVNEMALPLKTFRQRVDGLQFQLIENWCLLKYCQLYSPNNVNIDHWGSEFLACTKHIRNFEIKGGINKQKTINKMFISDYDYNQSRKILPIIQDKFDIEKIHDNTQREAVATEFSNSINSLIAFLCDTSISNAKYMKTTFNMDILSPDQSGTP